MPERDKTAPTPQETRSDVAPPSPRSEIDAFLKRARTLAPPVEGGKRGRLIFALDATMSRQPTWDTACRLQGEMFRETGAIGGPDLEPPYFPGAHRCPPPRRVSDGARLGDPVGRPPSPGRPPHISEVLN